MASDVNPRGMEVYRRRRLGSDRLPSIRTVNMEVRSVSSMLNWAVENYMIGSNPIEKLRGLRNDKKRKVRRSLALDEVHKIIDASSD